MKNTKLASTNISEHGALQPKSSPESIDRREAVTKIGIFAACTAPLMTNLLVSKRAFAMSAAPPSANPPNT